MRNHSEHTGYTVPSETYRPSDQGTMWPEDSFTGMVVQHPGADIAAPVAHSYAGDGNMEAFVIAGPYVPANEASTDVGAFTGATGPTGHVTPATHPEITAP